MTAAVYNDKFDAGRAYVFSYTFLDDDGDPINILSWDVVMTILDPAGSVFAVVNMADWIKTGVNGISYVIPYATVNALNLGWYNYGIKVTVPGNEISDDLWLYGGIYSSVGEELVGIFSDVFETQFI